MERVDQAWDQFLESAPRGQFQQSSKWGRTKASDGWQAALRLLVPGDPAGGGFQILWKQSRFGRIGYVSKGPVLPHEDAGAKDRALAQVRATARELGLRALIVQPPDQSAITKVDLCRHGFAATPIAAVIDATLVADVSGDATTVEAQMSRKVRQQARKAAKEGLAVFVGGREHLRKFFELMQATCRRQETLPSPSRPEFLEALWDVFAPNVRVSFAKRGDELVAGLLLIGFGKRMTFWKKGWSAHPEAGNANAFLNVNELLWTGAQGYAQADFVGMDRGLAEQLLAGRELEPHQERSPYVFNLRLGAKPQVLPTAQLLVPNPLARPVFNLISRFDFTERLMSRLMSAS